MEEKAAKGLVVSFTLSLLILSAGGLVWAILSPSSNVGILFAFVAGLVIAITPCCLPIFFVITSLTVKKEYSKGLLTALSFGFGFALIASVLGALLSLTGDVFGLPAFSGIVFALGGAVGYTYALSQLWHFRIPIPGFRIPSLQKRGTYLSAFSAGTMISLGEVGCPNPFRFILIAFIAAAGSVSTGATLGFVYGLGAVTPLILVAMLSLLGFNYGKAASRHAASLEKSVSLLFIPIGSFLMTFGIFGEAWYESTFLHDIWEHLLLRVDLISPHGHAEVATFSLFGSYALLLLLIIPIVGFYLRRRFRSDLPITIDLEVK